MIPLNLIKKLRKNPNSKVFGYMEKHKDRLVYIYSKQWNMYWRSNCKGYTPNAKEAGKYRLETAFSNTSHCGLEKRIFFEFIN